MHVNLLNISRDMRLINASQLGDGFGFYFCVSAVLPIADGDILYCIGGFELAFNHVLACCCHHRFSDCDMFYHIGGIKGLLYIVFGI